MRSWNATVARRYGRLIKRSRMKSDASGGCARVTRGEELAVESPAGSSAARRFGRSPRDLPWRTSGAKIELKVRGGGRDQPDSWSGSCEQAAKGRFRAQARDKSAMKTGSTVGVILS